MRLVLARDKETVEPPTKPWAFNELSPTPNRFTVALKLFRLVMITLSNRVLELLAPLAMAKFPAVLLTTKDPAPEKSYHGRVLLFPLAPIKKPLVPSTESITVAGICMAQAVPAAKL